ncbi:hypothetical protein RB597_005285 [Gaeumannomyces tritici]
MDTEMTTDATPTATDDSAPAWPDRAHMAKSADPQELSRLFNSLPLEIRKMIYAETWALDSQRQHLYREPHGRGMAHFPCLLHEDRFGRKPTRGSDDSFHVGCRGGGGEAMSWDRGLMTDWNVHWPCQQHVKKQKEQAERAAQAEQAAQDEQNAQAEEDQAEEEDQGEQSGGKAKKGDADVCQEPNCRSPALSPFLPLMLSCKRLYLECSKSIYEEVTFHLIDTEQAASFINSRLRLGLTCRSLEISLRFTPLLTELYFGTGERAVIKGRPKPVTADDNPWQRLCDALVRASSKDVANGGGGGMRDLRMWLGSSDLRPWHKRVYENRLFARLMKVEKPTGAFVVDLPLLPYEPDEKRGLPGTYLEDIPRGELPFEFTRSARTNNWMLHINRINHLRDISQS